MLTQVRQTVRLYILLSGNSALLDEHMKNVKNLSIKVSGELKGIVVFCFPYSVELEDSVQSTHLLPTDGIDRIKSYQVRSSGLICNMF